MNKTLIVSSIAGVVLLGGYLFKVNTVEAQQNGWDNRNSLMQKISQRFNLNQGEVEQVFNEERQERQAEIRSKQEEGLSQAVSEGKITEEQKQAIIAKREEMRARVQNFESLSPEERRTQMESHKEEMQKWASENGIDMYQIGRMIGGFGKGGRGGGCR